MMQTVMEMKVAEKGIHAAPLCPYCNRVSELVSSLEVYERDYGYIYLCRGCDAYVGCHRGTTRPLGRLANAELRAAKQAAHKAFDPLWMKGYMERKDAYAWLAKRMNLPPLQCHIGMMDVGQCWQVVEVCKEPPTLYRIIGDDVQGAVCLDENGVVVASKGIGKQFHSMKLRGVRIKCTQNGWDLELVDCESLSL